MNRRLLTWRDWVAIAAIFVAFFCLCCMVATAQTVPVNGFGQQQILTSPIDSAKHHHGAYDLSPNERGLFLVGTNGVQMPVMLYQKDVNFFERKLLTSSCNFCERTQNFISGYTVQFTNEKIIGFTDRYFINKFGSFWYTTAIAFTGGSVNSGKNSAINNNEATVNIIGHEAGHAFLRQLTNNDYDFTFFGRQVHEHFADVFGTFVHSFALDESMNNIWSKISKVTGGTYRNIRWQHYNYNGGYHNKSKSQSWVFHALLKGETDSKYFEGEIFNYDIEPIGAESTIKLLEAVAQGYGKDANGTQILNIFDWRDLLHQTANEILTEHEAEQVIKATQSIGLGVPQICPSTIKTISGMKLGKYEAVQGFEFLVGSELYVTNQNSLSFELTECKPIN